MSHETPKNHAFSSQIPYEDVSPIDDTASNHFPPSSTQASHEKQTDTELRQPQDMFERPKALVWQPGAFKRVPWLALGGLITAVLGIIAMTLVLVKANGKPINSWAVRGHNISPTVLLSLIVGIVNGCISFVMSEGVNISWWLKSLDTHTVVADLHRYWNVGTSTWAAVACGRHFNHVALASFLTFIITIADGPLLQRAFSPVDRTYNVSTTIAAQLAPGPLPSGFTGLTADHALNYFPTPPFHKIITDYQNRAPISLRYQHKYTMTSIKTAVILKFSFVLSRIALFGYGFKCRQSQSNDIEARGAKP